MLRFYRNGITPKHPALTSLERFIPAEELVQLPGTVNLVLDDLPVLLVHAAIQIVLNAIHAPVE